MDSDRGRFVPKVHPATRPVELDDPMHLNATLVEGDVDLMLRSIVQEFAGMGWNADSVLGLFRDPFYPTLHGLWSALGEEQTRARIEEVLAGTGTFRFRTTIVEAEPDEDDHDHDHDHDHHPGPGPISIGIPAGLLGKAGGASGPITGAGQAGDDVTRRREGDGHVEGR